MSALHLSCRRFVLFVSLLAVALPSATAHAATASELLPVQHDTVVSRGAFLRAAVKALQLNVKEPEPGALSQYVRVARGYRPYAAVAHERGALRVFGKDLRLSRSITRGEAVQLVRKLGDFDPVSPSMNLRDVRAGTSVEGAVGVALQEDWLKPLRENYFGTTRQLQPEGALQFIAELLGQEAPVMRRLREDREKAEEERKKEDAVQTIRLRFAQPETKEFPKGAILQTLWQLIDKNYLYQDKVDADKLAYDAAEAIMQSLDDPYSVFMRPANSKQFQTQIQGKVTGIGAQVEYKNNILTVVTPLRGSPAAEAGLQPGDKILAVNDESIVNIGFTEAVDKVRGPEGSTVELTIQRNGTKFTLNVQRDVIKVPEIETSWQGDIAVVHLLQFGAITDAQLRPTMAEIQQKNPKGIILDLRNNPGGLLHAANNVVSNFVEKGSPVAVVKAIDSERTEYTRHDPTIDEDVPVVVLVNGGSASAAEIVAGALQDLNRVTVIGENTFGKGTVQQVLQFNDQSAVKMTVAEWLTPERRKIDATGIRPDIVVKTAERDEQLSRALQLLRN